MKKLFSVSAALITVVSILCCTVSTAKELERDDSGSSVCTGGHSWAEGVIDTLPTCSGNGKINYKCLDCDAMRSEIIPSGDAYHVYDNDCDTMCNVCGVQRTVSHVSGETIHSDEDGHYYICKVCGEKISSEEHKFGSENEDGVCRCEICGYSKSNSEDHGHKLKEVKETAPTCTEPGNKKYYICTECSMIFSDSKGKKPITDHDSVVIAPKGHTPENGHGKVPTCVDEGEYAGTICSECGTVILSSRSIPKISHIFENSYNKNSHCLKCEFCGFAANSEPHNIKIELFGAEYLELVCDCGYSTAVKISEIISDNEIVINLPAAEESEGCLVEISSPALAKLNELAEDKSSGVTSVRIVSGGASVLFDKYFLSNALHYNKELIYNVGYSFIAADSDLLSSSQREVISNLPKNTKIVSVEFNCIKSTSSSVIVTNSTVSLPYELPSGWSGDGICVYRLNIGGDLMQNDCEYDGKTLTYRSDGSGIYVITKTQNVAGASEQNDNNVKKMVLIADAVLIVVVIVVVVVWIIKKNAEEKAYFMDDFTDEDP